MFVDENGGGQVRKRDLLCLFKMVCFPIFTLDLTMVCLSVDIYEVNMLGGGKKEGFSLALTTYYG